jgi:hypothetical protein
MTEENKELATKQETAIAHAGDRRGFEGGIDSEDLIIPRAMLIQNTPPRTVAIDRKVCVPGTIINSLTALPIPTDDKGNIFFIPVIVGRKWIRFNAQEPKMQDGSPNPLFNQEFEPGAKIWESKDPRDERVIKEGSWGKNNEPPLATKILEFLCVILAEPMPLVISFSKTSFKAGKQLASMCQYSGKADMFATKYRLSVKTEKNDRQQEYFSLAVGKIGDSTTEEFARAEGIYKSFVGKELKVHGEEDTAEPVSPKQPWEL